MRKFFLAAAFSLAAALPARAQFGAPVDPGLSYTGPFGPATSGGVERFAQTFMRPNAGFNFLQTFTFYLGDWNPDASGTGLSFQAAIYEVNGSQLGNQLYLSSLLNGSANYAGFDSYTFSTPNLYLDPLVSTFAIVYTSVSNVNNALNVIAQGDVNFDYANGALFVADASGVLTPAIDGVTDAAFDATMTLNAVPEPTSFVLVMSGLGFMGVTARRKRHV